MRLLIHAVVMKPICISSPELEREKGDKRYKRGVKDKKSCDKE